MDKEKIKDAAAVIDAKDRIVMPGLIDTHHHHYQAVLRGIIADGSRTSTESLTTPVR